MPNRTMKPRTTNVLLGAILAASSLGCGGASSAEPETPITIDRTHPTGAPASLESVVRANNRFSAELYRAVANPRANQTVSPYSIATAFGMVREGAAGETRVELDRALHFEGDVTRAEGELAERIEAIGRSGLTLRTANRVFVEDDFPVLDAFRDALADGYRAPFEAVSFVHGPDAAREHINAWVSGQTNDRIQDLLPPGSVTVRTRLVLTNAVYFFGTWLQPFEREHTEDQPFYVGGGAGVPVPTMQATRRLSAARVDGVTVGELPYAGGELSMVVVVPDARDGLSGLLSSLDEGRLARWIDALSRRPDVRIALPRFRITPRESVDLVPSMRALGVEQAFDEARADLSGITGNRNLVVSAAVHRAFIEVNEEGTEAAAATGLVVELTSAAYPPPEPIALVADRPFFFFIRDPQTGLVLFMGHVVDPRADAG